MADVRYVSLRESREEARNPKPAGKKAAKKRAAGKKAAKKRAEKNTTTGGSSASKPEEGSA